MMKKFYLALVFLFPVFSYAYVPYMECSAYSASGAKIYIKGEYGNMTLIYNGKEASLIRSSKECGENLYCNLIKGYSVAFIEPSTGTGARFEINFGEILSEFREPMRGGEYIRSVIEISPVLKILQKRDYLHGVCLRN